jgi:hypothetical protein
MPAIIVTDHLLQFCFHFSRAHHNEVERHSLANEPLAGLNEIVRALMPLKFCCVEHDWLLVMDAKRFSYLSPFGRREVRSVDETLVVDRVGHAKDSRLRDLEPSIEGFIGGADRKKSSA